MLQVGVNGFGTIGKRVADAISAQPDMDVLGVAKRRANREAWVASNRGFSLYTSDPDEQEAFYRANIPVSGDLTDLIVESDIIVDATPSGIGERFIPLYSSHGTPAILQGGEEAAVADVSFNSSANFTAARNAMIARVVSCNTTGLARTLAPLDEKFDIQQVRATLIRRGGDPNQTDRGPINDILPNLDGAPSHHAPDVQTVLPDLPIDTVAVKVPATSMHVQAVNVSFRESPRALNIQRTLFEDPRIFRVPSTFDADGIGPLSDFGEDLLRPRGDLWETCLWEDSVTVSGDDLYLFQAIDQRCNVVPEIVDAIRAVMDITSRDESVAFTNETLGIGISPARKPRQPA